LVARGDPCQRWGIDVVRASGGSLARLTNQCRFFGTARGDRLRGSPFLDDLYGFGGDDRLDGRGGRDRTTSRPDRVATASSPGTRTTSSG
jgi:hypothetical protein